MDNAAERIISQTRRQFMRSSSLSLGAAAFSGLVHAGPSRDKLGRLSDALSFAPQAKRVIYLFQSGGPSQVDLFDHKPQLKEFAGQDLPPSVRMGQRLTGFTNKQKTLPVTPTRFQFKRHGQGGAWVTELLPNLASVADDICFMPSIYSEAINHDPARTLMQTGHQLAGRPSIGAWLSYGLGSENQNLPAFMVLTSIGSCKRTPQPVSGRLWESGFLPSQYQGVKLQSVGDPILYVSNPKGVSATAQGRSIEAITRLNGLKSETMRDPEIQARMQQYEMAFRMQTTVPELTDLSTEPDTTFKLYGEKARVRGTYAANCLLARRMAERGVPFIQLYHVGWDHHRDIPRDLPLMCNDVDQPTAGLLKDLKQRGLLDDTLVIWGSEFGRTVFSQGASTPKAYGRDHHSRCFTMWMAGGGIKPGITYGASDDFSYNPVETPVHVHDLQATILHQLGINHERLTYRFQGRDYRLTDVHGQVVKGVIG
jgi:uncharacterized protein (DUF1501 family)